MRLVDEGSTAGSWLRSRSGGKVLRTPQAGYQGHHKMLELANQAHIALCWVAWTAARGALRSLQSLPRLMHKP
jgi:hypothetical protein